MVCSFIFSFLYTEALSILESEIIVDDGPALISADVRKTMAVSLLYKVGGDTWHQDMKILSTLLAFCEGNSPWIPLTKDQ